MPKIIFPTYSGKCKGTKKDGTPCKRINIYENGLCRDHGGISAPKEVPTDQERMAAEKDRIRRWSAKARIRSEKFMAKWRAMTGRT